MKDTNMNRGGNRTKVQVNTDIVETTFMRTTLPGIDTTQWVKLHDLIEHYGVKSTFDTKTFVKGNTHVHEYEKFLYVDRFGMMYFAYELLKMGVIGNEDQNRLIRFAETLDIASMPKFATQYTLPFEKLTAGMSPKNSGNRAKNTGNRKGIPTSDLSRMFGRAPVIRFLIEQKYLEGVAEYSLIKKVTALGEPYVYSQKRGKGNYLVVEWNPEVIDMVSTGMGITPRGKLLEALRVAPVRGNKSDRVTGKHVTGKHVPGVIPSEKDTHQAPNDAVILPGKKTVVDVIPVTTSEEMHSITTVGIAHDLSLRSEYQAVKMLLDHGFVKVDDKYTFREITPEGCPFVHRNYMVDGEWIVEWKASILDALKQ
jgi:hypothetical protein